MKISKRKLKDIGFLVNRVFPQFPLYPEYEVSKTTKKEPCQSIGENHTRKCLMNIFKKEFITLRPDFLKNPETQRNLELDFYNAELGIAVEYNGKQHYELCNHFQSDIECLKDQIRRDRMKMKLCKKHGICLISIPYTIKQENIQKFIYYKLLQSVNLEKLMKKIRTMKK